VLRVVDPQSSEDLVVQVINFQQFTDCHHEAILDLNCDLLHRRREKRSSDYQPLLFEPGSAWFFSTPPLVIVWSNYQTMFNDFLEGHFTKRWLHHQNVQTDVQFNPVDVMTSSIILHSDWSVVSQLTNTVNMTIVQVCKYKHTSVVHLQQITNG